jgi:hypothetical protein
MRKLSLILKRANSINHFCSPEKIFKYANFQVKMFEFGKATIKIEKYYYTLSG